MVRRCAPVVVSNTIKSPAESNTDKASAKLVVNVKVFTVVAPSNLIVLPVKPSAKTFAQRTVVVPKSSVESVSLTTLPPWVTTPVIVTGGVMVRRCAPVVVSNTIKSPAESNTDKASAKLVVNVKVFTVVAPSNLIVLPVKPSAKTFAQRTVVVPKSSVESVSLTTLPPWVVTPAKFAIPSTSRVPVTYRSSPLSVRPGVPAPN